MSDYWYMPTDTTQYHSTTTGGTGMLYSGSQPPVSDYHGFDDPYSHITTTGDYLDPDEYYKKDPKYYNTDIGRQVEEIWDWLELGPEFHRNTQDMGYGDLAKQLGHEAALDPDSYINMALLYGIGTPNPITWLPSLVGTGYQTLAGFTGLPTLGDFTEDAAEWVDDAIGYDPDARWYDNVHGTNLPKIINEKSDFQKREEIKHYGYSSSAYDRGTGGKKMYY